MNKPDDQNFEGRLLAQLKAEVAKRGAEEASHEVARSPRPEPPRRRRWSVPRLAMGGAAAALGAVALALVVGGGGDNAPEAFAVETQDGGGVTISVHSLEDASGLEAALVEAGIPAQVDWLPAGMTCREPRYAPSEVTNAMGGKFGGMSGGGWREYPLAIGVMTTGQYKELRREYGVNYESGEYTAQDSEEFVAATGNFTLDPNEFRPGQSVVLSGSPGPFKGDPEGGYEFKFGIAEGPVEPCEPVAVPVEDSLLHETEEVFREEREEREAETGAAGG